MTPKTRRGYRYQAGCLLRFSGKDSCDELTQADVDAFRLNAQGLSAESIETAIRAAGALSARKFSGARLKSIRPRNKTVPLDDLSRVHAVAKERGNVFIARWLRWAYITGFRLSDLTNLSREQMAADVIELDARKTGKYHAIPKHPLLRCRLPESEYPLRKSPSRLRNRIKYYCRLARVPYFTPQAIRRTTVTQYELARPGAGGVIQGSALWSQTNRAAVTWKHYIDQVAILTEAQLRLAIPDSMLPTSERLRRRVEEAQLLASFRRIGSGDRDAVLRMVSRLSW